VLKYHLARAFPVGVADASEEKPYMSFIRSMFAEEMDGSKFGERALELDEVLHSDLSKLAPLLKAMDGYLIHFPWFMVESVCSSFRRCICSSV
jgi:hypothetical protein